MDSGNGYVPLGRRSFPDRENHPCKSPEVAVCLVSLRVGKEAWKTGAPQARGNMVGNEVRERTRGRFMRGCQGLRHDIGHVKAISGLKGQSKCCMENSPRVKNRRSRRPVGSVFSSLQAERRWERKGKDRIQGKPARSADELMSGWEKKEVKDCSWFCPKQPEEFCRHFLKRDHLSLSGDQCVILHMLSLRYLSGNKMVISNWQLVIHVAV